jgi:hypothetical protein
MKEESPIGNPFIGEPRGGRPAKDGGRVASHVASAPKLCPKVMVVELKREIVEGKEERRKGGRRWSIGHQSLADRPCLASTQSLLSSSTSSCSYHAHSTDQKHQK